MRHDEGLAVRHADLAAGDFGLGEEGSDSFSGHERNKLFLADPDGPDFLDVSAISGLDHIADGRAFATIDADRDGLLDVVVVNANEPHTLLYRNRLGELPEAAPGGAIAVRLVGANDTDRPDPAASNRDGVGAEVHLVVDGLRLRRVRNAGEGLAAQNSATLLVGIGDAARAERVEVHWPSGAVTTTDGTVAAGTLLTAYEDAAQSPTGAAFVLEDYVRPRAPVDVADPRPGAVFGLHGRGRTGGNARLRLYSSMATWCEVCRGELPHLGRLAELFREDELALYALPADPKDTPAMLADYVARHAPAYEMLADIGEAERQVMTDAIVEALDVDNMPASVVTDSRGRVLAATWGVPTVSELRALLARAP